jgi:hypothetical protein
LQITTRCISNWIVVEQGRKKQTIAAERCYGRKCTFRADEFGRIQPADTPGSSSLNVRYIASARRSMVADGHS